MYVRPRNAKLKVNAAASMDSIARVVSLPPRLTAATIAPAKANDCTHSVTTILSSPTIVARTVA